MIDPVVAILERAIVILDRPRGWMRGDLSRYEYRAGNLDGKPHTESYCSLGGIDKAVFDLGFNRESRPSIQARELLCDAITDDRSLRTTEEVIVQYNDDEVKSKRTLLKKFREAIEKRKDQIAVEQEHNADPLPTINPPSTTSNPLSRV